MLILKDVLLWALVSVHVVGGAFAFRRVLPRESRWLAFVLPEVVFVLLCNFLEHEVALVHLRLLLPVTSVGAVAAIFWRGSPWRVMRLPSLIFVGAFTFTLGLRCFWPAISAAQDGAGDLAIMTAYLHGQTLPPEGTWMSSVRMESYYSLGHYGAALLTRLLGVDPGTGFNLSEALLAGYIYFIAGGLGWQLGRGKLWIAILCVVLTGCAATGTAGYVWLLTKNPVPDSILSPHALADLETTDVFLLRHLNPLTYYARHILMPPGYGAWRGYLHSTQEGQLIIAVALLAMVEALRRRRSDSPWLAFALTPFLMLTCCTWGVPMIGFIAVAGVVAAFFLKARPRHPAVVIALAWGGITLLEPMLSYFLNAKYDIAVEWVTDCHTEVLEFLSQWWPLYLPMLALVFLWKRLHPVTRIVLIFVPVFFAAVETWTAGLRSDTTQKCWGIIFAAGWLVFVPEILRQRTWVCRAVGLALVANCVLALGFWTTYYNRAIYRDDVGQLQGLGPFRYDGTKARLLELVSRLPEGTTILPGSPDWAPQQSGLLPLFTGMRAYLITDSMSDWVYYPNSLGEGYRRNPAVAALYKGELDKPVIFLRQNNIAAVVINPDDNIHPPVLVKLRAELEPYYVYEEANDRNPEDTARDANPTDPAAGVFVYRPEIAKLLGEPKGK